MALAVAEVWCGVVWRQVGVVWCGVVEWQVGVLWPGGGGGLWLWCELPAWRAALP